MEWRRRNFFFIKKNLEFGDCWLQVSGSIHIFIFLLFPHGARWLLMLHPSPFLFEVEHIAIPNKTVNIFCKRKEQILRAISNFIWPSITIGSFETIYLIGNHSHYLSLYCNVPPLLFLKFTEIKETVCNLPLIFKNGKGVLFCLNMESHEISYTGYKNKGYWLIYFEQ